MDLEGGERAIGDGPENQQTCVKWVKCAVKMAYHRIAKPITDSCFNVGSTRSTENRSGCRQTGVSANRC